MLYLIGLGIGSEKDISLKGLEACGKCEDVYVELYTASWPGDIDALSERIGKEISVLKRSDVEEKVKKLVKRGKDRDIAVLVPGDPLSATTHLNILMEAREQKVEIEIIHSSSILTAVAETGLSLYNFGRAATLVRPQKKYAPTSFYDTGVKNRELGMHTLFLLDVDMDTGEGLFILMDIGKDRKEPLVTSDTKLVAAAGLGTPGSAIKYGKALELLKQPLEPPAVLILPGKLHFTEKEFLQSL
jgi:diphthine synthase